MSEWIPICALADIPALGSRRVQRERGLAVAVFRTADDQVFALLDRCPHKGGPLSQGIVFGRQVACPLHNWNIGLADGQAAAPDEGCTPNGCASCRPAVNYYLISSWPKEAKDDPQSRFINERSHANIQKDGTYSVIPRMWGGETTADELRRIANAVDKYKIPTVKVTGGQRIDLLGVKKEDLPAVWQDIGMPSGHAYAKALRTVKTCVGSEWCRFGTQDSTQMGKDLERAMWRMYAPHKVKFAVSGCPRNCAEAGIKDVGVIGVDSGWEIYVGGNGGIKTEVAVFLVKLKTPAEVLEYSGAFLQLYREEGWYLERTVHYLARVGLDHVKKRILDDAAGRRALWERLQFSLDGEPDPWFEFDKAQVDLRQFAPLQAAAAVDA